MATVKYDTSHHAGPDAAARLKARERNSGCNTADVVVQPSQGARYHNIHWKGQPPAARRVKFEEK